MSNELLARLLELCRLELQVTWTDTDTDKRITAHIKNGVTKIKELCGVVDEDFEAGGKANALLLAYVRRGNSGDLSTFEADYLHDIISLQTDFELQNGGADNE